MASHDKSRNAPESKFSFAVGELQQAALAHKPAVDPVPPPPKAVEEDRGVDPYNTSGRFDRKNDWARVGKR
jgi:hypothetical protein